MFKSIKYIVFVEYDEKTKLDSAIFKITDDDFEEEISYEGTRPAAGVGMRVGAVITCYSKRSLPVAKNLIKMFQHYEKQYGTKYYSIQQQILYCEKHQPLFLKYKEEIEKYLLLL